MAKRFILLVLGAALAAGAFVSPVFAQERHGHDWIEPPKELPKAQRGDRTPSLDTLFQALKIAPDDSSAKAIEDRIWTLWISSGSDTCNLLMSRVKTAMDEKNVDLAIRLLDAVIELKPDYVEGWNRRATLYFQKRDYEHAMSDLAQVLNDNRV